MEYMTVDEASNVWDISPRRVSQLCSEGRIIGVELFGNQWAIPKDSEKPNDARRRSDFTPVSEAKPFIKWAGGKGQLLPVISKSYPDGLGETIRKYAEPFIGGGAVLFDILNKYELDEVYISDINEELIGTYRTIRDDVEELLELLSEFESVHLAYDMSDRKTYYLSQRSLYNELKQSGKDVVKISALFIYLNKTCFNGLYRVNSKGLFNVPSGVYKNPAICDTDNILNVSSKLQSVQIEVADFEASREFVDSDTFVYFDPPYRPLTTSSSFTSYTELSFDDNDQIKLAQYVKSLSDLGAKVAVSNSDPKNVDLSDNFFDELYSSFIINRVPANRMINSKSSGRGKINELLITNYAVNHGELFFE